MNSVLNLNAKLNSYRKWCSMSFSFDTKCEICDDILKKQCCKASQLYGMALFAQHIELDYMKLTTENVMVINILNNLANEIFNINFNIGENVNSYYAYLEGQRLQKLYDEFFININGKINFSISNVLTENICCSYAFLKGAFLSAGYISNPESSYHFEISTPYYPLAKSLESFMQRLDFPAKTVVRKSNYVVYMKGSEQIERFLCYVGANSSAFSFMDAKIYKEMNNYSNRINNTKLHNIEKTLNKSVEQIKAINLIETKIGLDSLESDLAFAALLRKENPDKSLNELVVLCDNKFSRSSLNRKLSKLSEIALKLGENNE